MIIWGLREWDFQPNNKLHKIYPSVHHIPPLSSQFSRRDQVVYNRLRIGHSYPTHSYLLHKDPQPLCIPCHSFSIEHILTECIDFQPIRVNYYSTSDISQLFHKVHPSSTRCSIKMELLYFYLNSRNSWSIFIFLAPSETGMNTPHFTYLIA